MIGGLIGLTELLLHGSRVRDVHGHAALTDILSLHDGLALGNSHILSGRIALIGSTGIIVSTLGNLL